MTAIRVKRVAAKLGVSVSTVWRLATTEGFPRPFKLGQAVTVWDEADIDAYLLAQKTKGDGYEA